MSAIPTYTLSSIYTKNIDGFPSLRLFNTWANSMHMVRGKQMDSHLSQDYLCESKWNRLGWNCLFFFFCFHFSSPISIHSAALLKFRIDLFYVNEEDGKKMCSPAVFEPGSPFAAFSRNETRFCVYLIQRENKLYQLLLLIMKNRQKAILFIFFWVQDWRFWSLFKFTITKRCSYLGGI